MSDLQISAKKKQTELEGKVAAAEKLVIKNFGVENEMVTLRSTILEKDN